MTLLQEFREKSYQYKREKDLADRLCEFKAEVNRAQSAATRVFEMNCNSQFRILIGYDASTETGSGDDSIPTTTSYYTYYLVDYDVVIHDKCPGGWSISWLLPNTLNLIKSPELKAKNRDQVVEILKQTIGELIFDEKITIEELRRRLKERFLPS